jgi:hypothetical protein
VDFTVYKDGFTTARFSTLTLGAPEPRFEPRYAPQLKDSQPRAFSVAVSKLEMVRDSVTLTVENLEPGVNYFWRLVDLSSKGWVAGVVTRTQAPSCPVDRRIERP